MRIGPMYRAGLAAAVLLFASSGSAAAGVCPNEARRAVLGSTALPDCRAYELVSPSAKNGQPVSGKYVSPDGERVVAYSIGGFAGSNQGILSFYEFARGSDEWKAAPLNPSAAYIEVNANVLLATSPDLISGLFEYMPSTTTDARDTAFYERNLPSGLLVEIGPRLSPASLASNEPEAPTNSSEPSTSDALSSRVVYMLSGPSSATKGYLWPGDTTVQPTEGPGADSLYEYVGTGQSEPKLVGIRNEGVLVSNSEAQLISQCGTSLGLPERGQFSSLVGADLYNAVSAEDSSGMSRVFFTAARATQGPLGDACNEMGEGKGPPANELFAQTEDLSSGQTRTVAISEPTTGPEGDCAECNTSQPADAVFQGASSDGSKAFFLSEQHLLPGSEGENLYEYDFNAGAGRRVTLVAANMQELTPAERLQGVARVSEDGSHVYFVARSVLTSEPRGGGCLAELSSAELTEEEATKEGRCRPKKGADNLYVYNTEAPHTTFVATLSEADEEDWQQQDIRPVDATPSGRSVVFESSADLTTDDTSSVQQVFEYDAQTETLARVSRPQSGYAGEGEFGASIVFPEYFLSSTPAPQRDSVSEDGSFVVFQSRASLTPQAAAGINNVYEYHDGAVSLISDGQDHNQGQGGAPSTRLVGVDSSGRDVFFATADRLVPQAGDTQEDMYDARIDGGFLPPAGREVCEGAGCRGPLAPVPTFGMTGSVGQLAGERTATPPPPPSAVRKARPLTAAQKLVGALTLCRSKHGRGKRAACEREARKRYGRHVAKKAKRGGR
jgi:hypothetical protein